MPFTLTLPKLSPTMTEGTIAKWHKKVGDHVEAGDLVFEVATDKATVEHNALDGGWLRKILVGDGGEAQVNQPIAIFTEKKDESIEGYKPEGLEPEKPVKAAAPEVKHSKKEGEQHAPVAHDSGAMKLPAFVPEPPLDSYHFEWPTDAAEGRLLVSPLARRVAKDKSLDLTTVKGSGPRGRIVVADLEKAQPNAAVAFGRREVPQEQPGTYEEIPMTPMRKAIGRRLQEAKTFIPHFYVTQDIDVEPIIQVREQLKKNEISVTYNDFVMRACALALRKHPNINSGYNSVNHTIIAFKTIDIAVAVTIDGGLITPIVRHADYKNLGQLSAEVRALAKRARDGKLDPQEYKGGSFTISNLGMYGVSGFQAIINPPQAAILAVSGIRDVPVVKNGAVVPGKRMSLSLSSDHRVIDGVAAAEFMVTVQKFLENPSVLLL